MDTLTALVAIALESGPADRTELAARLCDASWGDEEGPGLGQNLDDVLQRLADGGLIEPVSR